MTTTAGNGPEPPLAGSCTPAEKAALLPLCETLTVMPLLVTVPVTPDGFGGFSP
ncbi:hypothetical protein ABZ917_05255 [Nonomuraea wenchangensis]